MAVPTHAETPRGTSSSPGAHEPSRSFARRHPVVTGVAGLVALLAVAVTLFLWLANWNMLRGPISRFASARLHRHVEIDGDLKVHLLTFTPTVSVGDL